MNTNLFDLLDKAHQLWYSENYSEEVPLFLDEETSKALSSLKRFPLSFIHQICNMRNVDGRMRYHESFQNLLQRFEANLDARSTTKLGLLLHQSLAFLSKGK